MEVTAPPPAATTLLSAGITPTLLTAGTGTVNQKVYATAPIAPAPNALITVAVLGHASAGAGSPTVSGGGMTGWQEVATTTFESISVPKKRMSVYRAMSATPGSGPITITFNKTESNAEWIVVQWDGVDISGANGAGAIVQTGTASTDGATGVAVTLAPLGNANNVAFGVFGANARVLSITPGGGFAEIAEQPSGESPLADLQAEWATNDNSV
ncbi:MAG TPA: hypothetical protein VJS69_06910, partial [Candidatus Krumholzibacteria bacterium]|nr:hypothetical protein [Candidatus Krumholzibacteria bacterium]